MTLAHVRALAEALEARAAELEAGPWPPALGAYVREHVTSLRAELARIRDASTEENAALLEALGAEAAAALPLEALRGLLRRQLNRQHGYSSHGIQPPPRLSVHVPPMADANNQHEQRAVPYRVD